MPKQGLSWPHSLDPNRRPANRTGGRSARDSFFMPKASLDIVTPVIISPVT
jgi:hypothetical protein